MISRDPFGSDELNPLCAKGDQGWAGAHSTGSWEEAGRQTGRHVCAQTVRQLLAPLSVPTYCPYWHLPSALSQEEGTKAGSGRAGQPLVQVPPFLSLDIAHTTYLLGFALNRLGSGEEEKGVMAGGPDQRCPHPSILSHPPLLTPHPHTC